MRHRGPKYYVSHFEYSFLIFCAFQGIVVSLFKHQQQKMQEKGRLVSELSTLHCRAQSPRDFSVKDTGLAT